MAQSMQAAIGIENAVSGISMEWDSRGDAAALWSLLPTLAASDVVIGLGAPLLTAVGARVAGLQPFERLANGRYTMPATQRALWTFVPSAEPSAAFEAGERLARRLSPVAHLTEATTLFSYRHGRDLTGFRDGSANPKGDAAWAAALIGEGRWQGGSFVLVQRYLHFRDRFAAIAQAERDLVIGRREEDDEEIGDAPPTAHIKRTEQEDFEPPAFMVRRSMPWGEPRRHGLLFIAFISDLTKAQRMLDRMIGADNGTQDALLGHTQAETASYYFVPPLADGHLELPPITLLSEAHPMSNTEEIVESATVRLKVDMSRCIHSRNCVLSRPDVFVPNVQGPWLHPELASAEEIAEIAHQCPSGAIQYERLDGGPQETAPMRNVIRLRENGPLAIHGDFLVANEAQLRATLCRCGQSRRKPYCDGSHKESGFIASGEALTLTEPPNDAMPRQVKIQPIADGPLVIHGAVELVTGTGRTITHRPGPTLCRCGQSANKPFCDGSHARVGFKAPD